MRRRSSIRNGVEYCLALAASNRSSGAGSAGPWLARALHEVLDLALPRLRRVAYRNLALALPTRTARQSSMASSQHRPPTRDIRQVPIDPQRAMPTAGSGTKAANTSTGPPGRTRSPVRHRPSRQLGVSAYAHALLASPMNVIARPLDNPLIDRLVERRPPSVRQSPDLQEGFRARRF